MANTDYPATLAKLEDWGDGMARLTAVMREKYRRLKEAIATGEGDPNGIILTPDQIAVLEADVMALEAEVEALCSAHDVEPIEPPDPEDNDEQ